MTQTPEQIAAANERKAIVLYLLDVAKDHDRRAQISGHGRYHADACRMAAKYIEMGEHELFADAAKEPKT